MTVAANALCTVLLFPLLTDLLPNHRAADATGTLRATLAVAALLILVAAALLVPVRTPSPSRA